MTVHIGCSGWHYLHWRGDFYSTNAKPSEFLDVYLKYFNTVELNNSFYRLPTEKALLSWREAVPNTFSFSVKASRYITHNKKLKDSEDSFLMFFDRITLLADRLGPILFQLPPNWKYNGERLAEFISTLPSKNNYVFEFRNPDWLRDEMFELLRKNKVGFCIHDMPDSSTPEIITSNIAYIRFHGNGAKYSGGYSDDVLYEWAKKIIKWNNNHIHVFVYFNNDIGGFAPRNALTLKRMVNENI
jgi:uncharacterized protein YecE (DUF72 family)